MPINIVAAVVKLVIAVVVSLALAPKPKAPRNSVGIERRGVDVPLTRVYGTRRISQIATDEVLSQTLRNPAEHTAAGLINFAIRYRLEDIKTFRRRNVLLVEGPLCVSGRNNAPFSQLTNFQVNDKIYTDPENQSWSRFQPSSASAQVSLQGGTRLPFAEAAGIGATNNLFTHQVHMTAQYVQDLTEKIVFNGTPEATLDLTANRLWNPTTDNVSVIDDPSGWTGRADNPFLQILDLIFDDTFGYGVSVNDVNLSAFQECIAVSDIPVGVRRETMNYTLFPTDSYESGGGFNNGFYNYNRLQRTTSFSPRGLLSCHADLSTDSPVNEHIEELLLNTRGARIFNDRDGLIACRPAWIHVDDREQIIANETGNGPFRMAFVVEEADIRVTKNGALMDPADYDVQRTATFTRFSGYTYGSGVNDGPSPTGIDPDNTIGITFGTALVPSDTIVVFYDTVPSQPTVAHFITDPAHLGLDYDAVVDADGVMLIRIDTEDTFGVDYVRADEWANQCVVSFPDKDQGYETNQAIWPPEGSAQHLEFLAQDHQQRFQAELKVNTVTDLQDAMDHAEFQVRQSRSADKFVCTSDRIAVQLEPNDLVKVTAPEAGEDGQRLWRMDAIEVGTDYVPRTQMRRYEKEDYNYLVEDFGQEQTLIQGYTEEPVSNLTYSANDPSGLISAGRLSWERARNATPSGFLVEISVEAVWSAATTYAVGDRVYHNEDHWRALAGNTNSTPSPTNTDWLDLDDGWEFVANTVGLSAATPPISNARAYAFRVTPLSALNHRGEAAFIVTEITATGNADGLDLIPAGGRVAGRLSSSITINTTGPGTPDPGEVMLGTGDYIFPLLDGSEITRTLTVDSQLSTPWEGAYHPFNGRGFIRWGPVSSVGRFTGITYPANTPYLQGAYLAEHDQGQWYAVDNAGNREPYTPDPDDTVIATCFKSVGAVQIETLSIHVPDVRDGTDGVDGTDGTDGIPGTNGIDGQTTYTWVAYASNLSGTLNFTTTNPGTREYIGLAFNQTTPIESTDPTDYTWQKIVGSDGAAGLDGLPGAPGADGTPRYIWLAYADSADGTLNFTTGAAGDRQYIGLAPNQLTITEGNDPSVYTWSLIRGTDGVDGASLQREIDPIGVNGNGGSVTLNVVGDVIVSVTGSLSGFVVGTAGTVPSVYTMKVFRNGVEIASQPYTLNVFDDGVLESWFSETGSLTMSIADTPPPGPVTYTTQWSAGAWAQWPTEGASPVLAVEQVV